MPEHPAGEELLTPASVAALLFVDRKTVSRWATSGKLDSIRTPGGHRRFLRSDVTAIMNGSYERSENRPQIPAPRDGAAPGAPTDLAEECDSAAGHAQARVIAEAVATAAIKAARAAEKARGARAAAAQEAARTVARDAARTAVRVQIRADVAAAQVAHAAGLALDEIGACAGNDGAAQLRAVRLAATVEAAAESTAEDTARAAGVVATAVASAASQMERMTAEADDAFENEVSAAASALLGLTTETADRVAVETQQRFARVARLAPAAVPLA
jgi:excisionase family DNA binding protein